MNKQEAVEILTGLYRIPVEKGADEFAQEINKAIDMAIEALQDDWIPVSERLPEAKYGESDRVLVTKCWEEDEDTKFVEEAYFNGGYWCEPTGECITVTKVIAWMPLPEPYKEEQEHE